MHVMHCIFNVQLISNVKSQLPVIVCIKKNKKDANTESTALSYVQCKCTSYVHVHVHVPGMKLLDYL